MSSPISRPAYILSLPSRAPRRPIAKRFVVVALILAGVALAVISLV